MSSIDYHKLRVLVADDFSNFRMTVTTMLGKLGVDKVDVASHGAGVVDACRRAFYDLILCDYDLGRGRNGQQVLEELRHRSLVSHETVFIIISADASKDVVMAAYDCEPDDYLMKPITARMLQQRMDRLLALRKIFQPVNQALSQADPEQASHLLTDLSLREGRQSIIAQKKLGELFLQQGELNKAEKLYSKALEARPLEWAKLGLARVKRMRGEVEAANECLQSLINDNPLFLPAYDEMASNWEAAGDSNNVQQAVQMSVSISPKSILRQKRLANVAERNGDFQTALNAWRTSLKLGEYSCHADAEDSLNFARVATSNIEKRLAQSSPLATEILEVLDRARHKYSLSRDQLTRAALVEGRACLLDGNAVKGRQLIEAQNETTAEDESVAAKIERIHAMQALGNHEAADTLLADMLQRYAQDEEVLQQLDKLLEEPVSESNRTFVANINREGIDLYNDARFDEAVECFARARRLFPKHIGIQLNIVQALIGKLKLGEADDEVVALTQSALGEVGSLLDEEHPQYNRYVRLRNMATANIPS